MSFRVESHAEPIPGYRLIERIGGGGFGEVWKAEAPGGLLKAIKFVFGDLKSQGEDDADGHRAIQELKALERVKTVRHPYILSLERYDIVNGQLMIVMELADKNLWDRFRECRAQNLPGIPREELLRYMEETAEALDLMNVQYQLQHLDIKPQNIFLVYNHIKVADFGLVKDFQGVVASMTGGVTPVYASPETFDGLVTRFCDQYSLAIVYQELLTGQRPFTGTNVHQLVMQHVQGVPNLSSLPPEDRPAIARSLSKNPDDRFPTCMEMVQALRMAGMSTAAPSGRAAVGVPAAPAQETPPAEAERATSETISTGLAPPPEGVEAEAAERQEKEAAPAAAVIPVREELTGDGELMPALVIGLGKVGITVLAQFRAALEESFGSTDAVPNIRMLGIDTDPEMVQAATEQQKPLLPLELVLHLRLQRAIHYLRPREGRPRLDTWFDTTLLGRLPRDQTAGGMRPLGRLAFIDNYRSIANRVGMELETCLNPENLATASARTSLTLRTSFPRIYVISGLGGGTGSGMFIDLAYAISEQLRRLGFVQPDVVGLLLLPGIDKNTLDKVAMFNTVASLTELNHFSSPDVTFTARFDEKEGSFAERKPPFRCCYLLPLGPRKEASGADRTLGAAGDFLYRELVTPLGRAADSHRAGVSTTTPPRMDHLDCRSFGLSRFWWPRWTLLRAAARQLCRRVTEQWLSTEPRATPERIAAWVQEQWTQKELEFDAQVARLQAACAKSSGQMPEAVFTGIHADLTKDKRRGPNAAALREAATKIEQLVGRATTSTVLNRPGSLEGALNQEAELMLADFNKKLLSATAQLIEQPEFHLAGAEEAIRQLTALIDKAARSHESLGKEIVHRARSDSDRIQFLSQNIEEIVAGGRRAANFVTELVELIRVYPKIRYQSLLLKVINSVYQALKTRLADQVREVGFSRGRLGELLRVFEAKHSSTDLSFDPHALLPVGCKTLGEAVEQLISSLSPAEFADLDIRMQNLVQSQFRGFNHLCASGLSTMRDLSGGMIQEALAYATPKLQGQDIVAMFAAQHGEGDAAKRLLVSAYQQAAPPVVVPDSGGTTEFCMLATPPSPDEHAFRNLAKKALQAVPLLVAASTDDIVFYREEARIGLVDFEHVGPAGQEAYRQAIARDVHPPHTRTDITDWRAISK